MKMAETKKHMISNEILCLGMRGIPNRRYRYRMSFYQSKNGIKSQMLGYCLFVGSLGIQPLSRPALYDHSSAVPCSIFQVH